MDEHPLSPPIEQERLKAVLESASKYAAEMNRSVAQISMDLGKEKTQYFEKIALACAATIALVVSFVGGHAGRLQPAWLLRSALVALVLAMMGAMYRNWKFPFYILAVHAGQEQTAKQKKARCTRDWIVAIPSVAWENGKPIDVEQWLAKFEQDEKVFDKRIADCTEQEDSSFSIVRKVEYLTLFLTLLGMIMLVALAWENF
jgi:hypothetical protein